MSRSDRPLVIIEDPIDSTHVDPLRGAQALRDPRPVSTARPIGDGPHLLTCLECRREFNGHDDRAALCPACDDSAAQMARMEADYRLEYQYPRQTGVRNGYYPD